jgi:predicted Rossmann fold nucleotide-binding protein DprA/Smf involved in DNA uptake
MEREDLAAWLALAFRSGLPEAERRRIALGGGPDPRAFPAAVLAREAEELRALDALGARVLPIVHPDYPGRLREEEGPLVLAVAGRVDLLSRGGVSWFGRLRGAPGERLMETLAEGAAAVVVLAKGMLAARTLLRALHEPLDDGTVAVVSAEPPAAAWGPARDVSRDRLLSALAGSAYRSM